MVILSHSIILFRHYGQIRCSSPSEKNSYSEVYSIPITKVSDFALVKPRKFGEPFQGIGNTEPSMIGNGHEGVETSCEPTFVNLGDTISLMRFTNTVIITATKAGVLMSAYKDPEVLQKVYAECGSLVKTAEYFGVSKKLILTHLKRFDIPRNLPKQKTVVDVKRAQELLDSGVSMAEVARDAGVDPATIRSRLKEQGIQADMEWLYPALPTRPSKRGLTGLRSRTHTHYGGPSWAILDRR